MTYNKESYTGLIKKNPTATLWEKVLGGYPPISITIANALEKIKTDPEYGARAWMMRQMLTVEHTFRPFLNKNISLLTYKDLSSAISGMQSEDHKDAAHSSIRTLLRFVKNGKIIISKMTVTRGAEASDGVIGVSEHQYLDEEEALNLIAASRGRHAEFREQIVKQLTGMPDKKAYGFVPNLPKEDIERRKTLTELRIVINEAVKRTGQSLEVNYIPTKNLFILLRVKPAPKGVKNV